MTVAVGTGSIDITPPRGLDIAGGLWAAPSLGVRDPLHARALVLDDGATRAALVTLDVIGLERDTVLRARELIAGAVGIPGEHVLIACSHTHQGPATLRYAATSWPQAYMEELPRRIADVVATAAGTMAPAEWAYAQAEQGTLAHYRRAKLRNGRVRNTWLLLPDDPVVGPAGDIDPRLPLLAFRTGDRLQALFANFACHATCAGDGRWSANYPGYFAASLAERLGLASSRIFYTSGAAANTNPLVADAAEFGTQLAAVVPPALLSVQWRTGAHLRIRERAISLPARRIDRFPFDLIAEAYQPKFSQLNFGRVVKYYADEYVKLVERGPVPTQTALQLVALDDVALLAIPGELFVELGREIQGRSPFAHTIVVTMANDWVGYIPHRAAFEEGGYETIFGSQSRLAPEAGDMIVDAAVRLLDDTAGQRSHDE